MSTFAHGQGVFGTDHRPEEVAAAAFIAASMPVWIIIAWSITRLGLHAEGVPNVEKGTATPIRVTPMIDMDSPVLKGGNKKVKFPSAWEVAPKPTPRQKSAVVSPNSVDDPDAIPDPMPVYDGGAPPDPDASTTTNPDADVSPETGTGGGEPGELPGGEGDGGSPGSPDGNTTDRLKVRAAMQYRARLTSFFKAGFRCPQLPEGASKCSPTGSVTISGGLVVTSTSFAPCGVIEIDSAAQSVLTSKQGQSVPPPPEEYPELQMSSISFTYSCK